MLLEFSAIALIINNHRFHKSKFVSSANAITGKLYEKSSAISDYFHLNSQNKALAEENNRLKNLLEPCGFSLENIQEITITDSLYKHKAKYINAKIYKNEYHTPFNFILINKGRNNNVSKEMAVVNSKGIIGITDHVSDNYATVQSILNKNSKINARFKNNFHFGTLTWNGLDYNIVQLTDIPRQAVYQKGDTIITGGKSTIFPEGIGIGTVLNIPKNNTASNTIDIQLFNDMSNLGYVSVIKNLYKEEIQNLENNVNE